MTDEHEQVANVDDLLRRACADDLPVEVAAGMGRRIDAFLADAQAGRQGTSGATWLLPRIAWAVIAILMLLAGALLQEARVSSPLADRISSLKAAIASLETTRR